MRRAAAILAALAIPLAAVACGGGGGNRIGAAPPVERSPGLLGGSTAGAVRTYVPTGKIVADDGFRPWVDGFGFENYGNDVGPENMTAAQVEDLSAGRSASAAPARGAS